MALHFLRCISMHTVLVVDVCPTCLTAAMHHVVSIVCWIQPIAMSYFQQLKLWANLVIGMGFSSMPSSLSWLLIGWAILASRTFENQLHRITLATLILLGYTAAGTAYIIARPVEYQLGFFKENSKIIYRDHEVSFTLWRQYVFSDWLSDCGFQSHVWLCWSQLKPGTSIIVHGIRYENHSAYHKPRIDGKEWS